MIFLLTCTQSSSLFLFKIHPLPLPIEYDKIHWSPLSMVPCTSNRPISISISMEVVFTNKEQRQSLDISIRTSRLRVKTREKIWDWDLEWIPRTKGRRGKMKGGLWNRFPKEKRKDRIQIKKSKRTKYQISYSKIYYIFSLLLSQIVE